MDQYMFHNRAVTSGSAFINAGISSDPALRQKTTWVVIKLDQGSKVASLYRLSGKAQGLQSRDIYDWEGKKWRYIEKDEKKYATAPQPPFGAHREIVDGVDFWTMTPPTDEEKAQFREFLAIARRGSSRG